MNKLIVRLLLTAALASPLLAEPVSVGMPEADLLKEKGTPQTKAKLGKKSIYRWPDVQVVLVEGKVESFQVRNVAAERQDARERASAEAVRKAEVKIKARETVQDSREASTYARIESNAANREKEDRFRRLATLQQQIRSIEQQLSDDDKRSSFKGTPPMSSEARAYLNLRLDNMRSELATLR